MIMCGQLALIMKYPYRTHYHDFIDHAFRQVGIRFPRSIK